MSHWLKYGATLLHRRVLFSWAFLVGSSSCGIRRYSQLCNLQIPKRKIPAPCGISLPCSVVELKGQQISTSTVFMVSGMETLSRLKEFIWCHCDFRTTPPPPPPPCSFYTYEAGGGSSVNRGDSYKFFLQLFCCCLQSTYRDRGKWKHVILWLTVTEVFSKQPGIE